MSPGGSIFMSLDTSGIHVLGSRYALVLEDLQLETFDLNLREARVAVGPTRGRSAHNYIKGRVDKGCLEVDPTLLVGSPNTGDVHRISLLAKLQAPYAVFLR